MRKSQNFTVHYFNQYGAITLTNKPARATKKSIIDNVITRNIFDESLTKVIIKFSLSDHLPIFCFN